MQLSNSPAAVNDIYRGANTQPLIVESGRRLQSGREVRRPADMPFAVSNVARTTAKHHLDDNRS